MFCLFSLSAVRDVRSTEARGKGNSLCNFPLRMKVKVPESCQQNLSEINIHIVYGYITDQ